MFMHTILAEPGNPADNRAPIAAIGTIVGAGCAHHRFIAPALTSRHCYL
ncbi:hypothetical protein HG421_18165 [Xanthomonas campestris pv. badrii]|uniref:Uncharacterized protein n=1 Tax=Xanthomonas campestris pv. badrii TaxID=149696 RepID=A0A7Z2V761_XANCA|nr:hypothetical protein [Xanthomonas campestris]QJD66272.1 hypothetical protein HG421_18165 [Xanthomonas campestris pv. badrii]